MTVLVINETSKQKITNTRAFASSHKVNEQIFGIKSAKIMNDAFKI